MKFIQHHSSSSGNLYEVTAANGHRLLFDPGVTWARLQKALSYDLTKIDGCLLSHEHMDHAVAALDVMKAGINVYSSYGTLEALGLTEQRRAIFLEEPGTFKLSDSFSVCSFRINHDAADPFGYIVKEVGAEEFLFFAPDSSHIRQSFDIKFNIIAIECSYDLEYLKGRVDSRDINEVLAKRLLITHAEKQTTIKYLREYCDLSHCREVHLLHCSSDNLDKQATKIEFEKMFFIKTVIR